MRVIRLLAVMSVACGVSGAELVKAPANAPRETCVQTKHRNMDAISAWEKDASQGLSKVGPVGSRAWLGASRKLAAEKSEMVLSNDRDAVACMHAATPGGAPVLLVVGDSLASAYGIQPSSGWVALLEARIAERKWAVVNDSFPGRLVREGVAPLAGLVERYKPAIVILELGTNDALHGRDPEATRGALSEMIEAVRKAGATPVLVGNVVPSKKGKAWDDEYLRMYAELAKEKKVALVPYLLRGITDLQADNVHPAAAAQPAILENVWPVLEPLLKGKAAR